MRIRQSAALKRRKDIPVAYDDLDGTPILDEGEVRRVSFGLDGAMYEMDLSQAHVADLVGALQPFIDASRRRKTPKGIRRILRPPSGNGTAGSGQRRRGTDVYLNRLEESEFYRDHGHINVPYSMVIGDWSAGTWVRNFRRKHRRGELPAAVVARAESLGIDWHPQKTVSLDEALDRLEGSEFYRRRGHINVPSGLLIGGWNSGNWLSNFRQKFRRGGLSAETIARAEALGIKWDPGPRHGALRDRTDVYLNRLEGSEFFRDHGHINVPYSMVIGDWKAGIWLSNFRQKFRRGGLSAETIARAEALGLEWDAKRRSGSGTLDRLEGSEFFREHGHINVPVTAVIDGRKVGQSLAQLRSRHRRGELATSVVERAESLGIDWNPVGYTAIEADEGLDRLEGSEFYREHGHINVPVSMKIGDWRAGRWLGQIKGEHYRGALSPRVVARAEALGVEWIKPPKLE